MPAVVSVDELADRIFRRVSRYRKTGKASVILSQEAEQEADVLWHALQAAGPRPETAEEPPDASLILGWLYSYRHDLIEGDARWPELARTLLCFAPRSEFMPSGLGRLLGPEADHDLQAGVAMECLALSEHLGDPALLDAGIALLAPAAAALPDDDTDRGVRLTNLCLALRNRFERNAAVSDLERSITAGERAVATPGIDKVQPVAPRLNLSLAYQARFRGTARSGDIMRAIALLQELAASFAAGPQRSEWLTEVARAQVTLYKHGRNPSVLAQAAATADQAVADLPHDPKEAAAALFTLADVLYYLHQRSASADDLRRARELAVRCLAVLPEDHPALLGFLTDVARFHLRLHSVDDLHTAIWLSERAVREYPESPAGLAILAMALEARYRLAGTSADLDRAILLASQAVAAGRAERMPLTALASASIARYQHAGVLGDLDRAIAILRSLLDGPGGDRTDRAAWASLLGSACQQRFAGVHDPADLDRAIEFGELAVAETRPADPGLGSKLGKLAIAYQYGHDVGADPSYRARAIELGERAIIATPEDDPDHAGWLSNLAIAYLTPGYTATPTRADIDRAVELSEQALAAHPGHHADHVRLMANLAMAYRDLVAAGGSIDKDKVRELARRVTEADAAPVDRVWGRHAVGMLAQVSGEYRLAAELLDAAVALLPDVAPREAHWADQQYRLGEHTGLVGSAVAAHCAAGDPAGAVEAAELSRGVLLARQADARTGLAGSRRARLDPADLRGAAEGGSVVLVNADRYRGDAVIVRPDSDPVLVELPGLELKEVEERAFALAGATSQSAEAGDETPVAVALRRQRVLQETLGWLWDAIAAPVLAALQDEPSPYRIWWLPVGFLSVFPLHAAGHPGQDGVLDLAISSYIPTLGSLRELRSRAAPAARRQLVVAMERTPGLPDLPGTADEAADLHARRRGRSLMNERATADQVRTALAEATWAHFACHAEADLVSPASGGLWLHDGLLSLPAIGALRLPHAELAYLSACSTAHYGGRIADEALHPASAFHLAGFRHVIASLWPVDDRAAAEAARAFYRDLPDTPAAASAASALHQVTHLLRDAYPARPDLWAALIHSGS